MVSWIRFLDRIQQKIEKVLLFLGASLTIILMLLITLDVTLRKLAQPIPGSYELVQVLTVGIVFLGVAYVQRIKGHVFIEIATDKLPKKIQQSLNFFGYLVGFAVCFIITWQSGVAAWDSFIAKEVAPGIVQIPLWPAKIVILIGLGLLTLRLLLDIVYYFIPNEPIDHAKTEMYPGGLQVENPDIQIKEGEQVWH